MGNQRLRVLLGWLCWLAPLAALAGDLSSPARFEFQVTFSKSYQPQPKMAGFLLSSRRRTTRSRASR